MTSLATSFSSLPSEDPGAPKLLGPLGTPKSKASSSLREPDHFLSTCPACPGAVGSRKPYGWKEAGESGPLAPMSSVLDGKPGHPDPAGRTGDSQGGNVSGMSSECDSQVQPGPQEPRPRGFIYTGGWSGLLTILEKGSANLSPTSGHLFYCPHHNDNCVC